MPTFRSAATASSGGTTSLTITKPAGVAQGDFLVAPLTTFNATMSTPSGWTILPTFPRLEEVGTGSFRRLYAFTKVAGASEPANYAFAIAASTQVSGGIAAYSGVHATTPINASTGNSIDGDGTTVGTGTITPTVNDCTVIFMFGADVYNTDGPAGWSIPSATERFDVSDSTTFMTTALADTTLATAAAISRTGTIGGNTPCRMAGILALAPISGPPPPPPGTVVIPDSERDTMVAEMAAQITALGDAITDMTATKDQLAAYPTT